MDIKYTGDEALRYAKFIENSFSWDYLEKPIIESKIKPHISARTKVLDAGCGTGRTIGLLLEMGAKADNILATDVSPHMLEIAQENHPKVNYIQSDLASLEISGGSVDIILSNMVLQYLDDNDLRKAMNIFYHTLKNGGYILFIAVHPLRFQEKGQDYFVKDVKVEQTPWGTKMEYYPKKVSDYVNVVIEAGFDILNLDEPLPLSEGKDVNPTEYEKYSARPTRLAVWARKNS